MYTLIQPPLCFDEYDYNMHETESYDKISQVSLCGEQPKPNVDEGNVLFILIFGIPCFRIVFIKYSLDVHINLSHVSYPKNYI